MHAITKLHNLRLHTKVWQQLETGNISLSIDFQSSATNELKLYQTKVNLRVFIVDEYHYCI